MLIDLLNGMREKATENSSNTEIVISNSLEMNHELRKTVGVIRENILASRQSILITGYAISEFAKELIDLLILKSTQGVRVTFLIDKDVEESMFKAAIKLPNFKVYRFNPSDSYTHLHAKVMIFDKTRAFVSSSNLSYNGIINNIEIGILTNDKNVIKLNDVLGKLVSSSYFEILN
ncbi:phospholipase D-like domain-containing protein [Lysinibacillus sp. FSL L8-0126]|uniref:phospholipase D-like domain-containing protein n=1 Tax=Lysinibacillus sp. FSL L8-0126 TaxID=2921515 RepID=UPI00315B0F2B